MTRLGFLRMLGMTTMSRYGSLGQAHRRPDQMSDPPPSAVAPTQAAGILRARVVIIFGTTGGLFIYNGTPGRGTLILAAKGQAGTDPTGLNTVPAVFNVGVWDATTGILKQHFGIDPSGNLYLADAAGNTRIYQSPSNSFIGVYDSSGLVAGHLAASIASAATTDPAGNTVDAGITSYDNVFGGVTQLNGALFQLFSGINLLQKLNPSGYVIYSPTAGTGNQKASIAPAAFTDANSNAIPAGVTAYVVVTGTFAGTYAVNLNDQTQPWGTTVTSLTFHNRTNAENLAPAVTAQAHSTAGCNLNLQSGKTLAGSTPATVQVQDSVSSSVTGGLVDVIAGKLTVIAADGNVYRTERLSLFSSSTHVFNSATAFTIPGLSASVGIGTYRIEGIVYGVQGPNAANQIVQINGPAISFGRTYIESNADANTSVTDSNISGALPHQHSTPAWGAGVNFYVRFRGIYTFTAAGTLTVQGSTSLVANTWTSQTACLCDLMPV